MKFAVFICTCILYYGVIHAVKIYGVNYARNSINQIEKSPGLIIIFSLILSNPDLSRTGN